MNNCNTKISEKYGKRKTYALIVGENCSIEFWKLQRDINNGKHHYCSRNCFYKGNITKLELVCAMCGEAFFRTRSHALKKNKSGLKFCSNECKFKAQRTIGGIKAVHPAHYGEGRGYYRHLAITTYGCKCQCCGFDKYECSISVHHIDCNRENNAIENLIVVCRNCHAFIHYVVRKLFEHKRS